MDFTVNVGAVVVATVVYFALGAVWYMALSEPWMAALGITRADAERGPSPALLFGGTFLLEAVTAFTLAVLIGSTGVAGAGGGAAVGALVGVGIWFALMSVTFLYESRNPALFLIDGGYHVLALTAAGAILGAWPPA